MENKLKKALGLRKRDIRRMKKAGNFTLLELLIVVAVLAIIAGGIVGSFQNVEENAAQSQAARDIAAVDSALQTYSAFESGIPDNVDSLLQYELTGAEITADADSGDTFVGFNGLATSRVASAIDNRKITAFTGDSVKTNPGGNGGGLAGKVEAKYLTEEQVQNLQDAGLTKVRYIDAGLDDNDAATAGQIFKFGSNDVADGSYLIDNMDIPQNYFDAPRTGSNRNRGRGFAINVGGTAADIAANVQFAVWSGQDTGNDDGTQADNSGTQPSAKYNNTKIGANPKAVLVAFGLGPNNSLVGKDAKFGVTSGMPYYANVEKNEYNNYVMLVDVQQRPAKVVAVIDTKGDFRAEEFAEYQDQKL